MFNMNLYNLPIIQINTSFMFKKLGLQYRIILSLLTLLLFSFVLIGMISFYDFRNQNRQYHEDRLARKESTVVKTIDYEIRSRQGYIQSHNVAQEFGEYIYTLAEINNLDINFYNLNGSLILSSNTLLFLGAGLPEQIGKDQLIEIKKGNQKLSDEIIVDGVEYLSSYHLIELPGGSPLMILNIPYKDLKQKYQRDIQAYLFNLAKIYVVLFALGIGLAILLSKYITEPLKDLASKLKEVQINGQNQKIEWRVRDEIGLLIDEYNSLIEELGESAERLAKSEREYAWREMARQVAHEIKNPLTPMKLHVQFMEKTFDPTSPNWKSRMKEFTETLVDQIDTLSYIAEAFSDFAAMPKLMKEHLDLKQLAKNTVSFYENNGVTLKSNVDEVYVFADKNQLQRVLNNLIKNAIQAIPDDRTPEICIDLTVEEELYKIKVEDNGIGIKSDIASHIFEPRFTTKNSGMGLGLVMVKNIVHAHDGKIYFNSEVDRGTEFIVEIPIS